jgi:serine/threonine protein kinase
MIIHGDLKPVSVQRYWIPCLIPTQGSVLIDKSGRPRLCGFGQVQIFLDDETRLATASNHTGTERYLAPELVIGETKVYPTTQSDVYALGCLGLEVSCVLYHSDL